MRPTPGKVRETLYNWISFECQNKTFLDLFAGSGALSFEALSRGAKRVVSIEKNREAYKNLINTSKIIGSDKIEILNQDYVKYLNFKNNKSFDFVLLDPPFNQNLIPTALKLLSDGLFIRPGSKIYIESEFKITEKQVSEFFSRNIELEKQKKSGQVHYCLIEII